MRRPHPGGHRSAQGPLKEQRARGLEVGTVGAEGQTHPQGADGEGSTAAGQAAGAQNRHRGFRDSMPASPGLSLSFLWLVFPAWRCPYARDCNDHTVSVIFQQEAFSALCSNLLRNCMVGKKEGLDVEIMHLKKD